MKTLTKKEKQIVFKSFAGKLRYKRAWTKTQNFWQNEHAKMLERYARELVKEANNG